MCAAPRDMAMGLYGHFISAAEDLKRLSDRLVEVNATNLQLQMKLDELEALEVSIKVHSTTHGSFKSDVKHFYAPAPGGSTGSVMCLCLA